jgi:condensin complex subunit 3
LKDTVAQNAVVKFETAVSKKFEKQLEGFDESEYRQLERLKDLFEFLDDIIPDEDEEEIELPKKRTTRKRLVQNTCWARLRLTGTRVIDAPRAL